MLRPRREAALVAYRAFSDVAGKGAFFLVTVFAARRLSQHGFGVFSLGTTVGWLAAVATDFGMQLHLARQIAQRPADAARVLRAWLRVRFWTSASVVVLGALTLVLLRLEMQQARAILLLLIVYVVSSLIEFTHYFYRAISRSDIESTLTLWHKFATLIVATAVLVWRPDVTYLALAMLLPVAATLIYSVRRALRLAVEHAEQSGAPTAAAGPLTIGFRSTMRDVVPIGIGIVLSALYFRIDVFLIELWQGTNAVGLYNAVFRLVEALRLFPAAVLAVALPALFRATDARPLLSVSALLTGFSIVVAVVLGVAAHNLVMLLYGERYLTAVPAFRILLLSLPLMSLNYAMTHQLLGWSGHRAYALICGIALVFNVALNARLIPALSLTGAAWTTLGTEALLTVGCAIALWMRSARPSADRLTAAVLP
jgi:O-antigen/teichoic acid export membrane protein